MLSIFELGCTETMICSLGWIIFAFAPVTVKVKRKLTTDCSRLERCLVTMMTIASYFVASERFIDDELTFMATMSCRWV